MFFKYMLSNHLYTPCRPIPNLQTLHNNSEISVACFFPAITTGPINHLNGRETGHFFFPTTVTLRAVGNKAAKLLHFKRISFAILGEEEKNVFLTRISLS